MKVHFFTKGDINTGSSRLRAYQIAEALNVRHFISIVHTPSSEKLSQTQWPKKGIEIFIFVRTLFSVRNGDVLYLQRTIYNKYMLLGFLILRLFFKGKIIFDFDDAIFIHSPLKTRLLIWISDYIFVGSHYLQSWAKKYSSNVALIPTALKAEHYLANTITYIEKEVVTIGWVGNGPAHYENLCILIPVFEELLKQDISIKFILVGAMYSKQVNELFSKFTKLDLTLIQELDWGDPLAVPKIISTFDIGVMPLIDSEWSKGKCSLKAIEYMMCGVPTICSAVGENNYVMSEGGGLLASNTEEWVKKIKMLLESKDLRKQLGITGQRKALENYSLDAIFPMIFDILST